MTDKVQKIREEVERLRKVFQLKYQQLKPDDKIMCLVVCGKRNLCNDLISFIDSLQEEPVSEDLEEAAHKYADGENPTCPCEECLLKTFKAGAKWGENQAKVEFQTQSMALAHGCPKEPVNEDLEEAAIRASMLKHDIPKEHLHEYLYNDYGMRKFVEGAKWQEEKDNEEKVLTYKHGFDNCKEHIKEVLLSEVLPCFMHGGEADEVVAKLDEVLN